LLLVIIFSILFIAISILSGGTEATMMPLLLQIRLVILWFAVALGVIAMSLPETKAGQNQLNLLYLINILHQYR